MDEQHAVVIGGQNHGEIVPLGAHSLEFVIRTEKVPHCYLKPNLLELQEIRQIAGTDYRRAGATTVEHVEQHYLRSHYHQDGTRVFVYVLHQLDDSEAIALAREWFASKGIGY